MFLCIAIFDWCYFTYHPLEKNVMINVSSTNQERKTAIDELMNEHQVTSNFSQNILGSEENNVYSMIGYVRQTKKG